MKLPKFMQVEDLQWYSVVSAVGFLGVVSCMLGVYGQPWILICALAAATVTHEMPLTRGGHITAALIVGSFFALGLLWSRSLGTAVLGGIFWALCLLLGPAWDHIGNFLRRSSEEFREWL